VILPTLIKYPPTLCHEKFMTHLLCSVHYLTHFCLFILVWLFARYFIPDFQHALDTDFPRATPHSHPTTTATGRFLHRLGEAEGTTARSTRHDAEPGVPQCSHSTAPSHQLCAVLPTYPTTDARIHVSLLT